MIKREHGFTLIELMMALAIIGVLAAIAYPVYQNMILKSRRSEALTTLLNISAAEEKYRVNNTTYGTLAQVWNATSTANGYYTLASSGVSATGYTITATATGYQVQDTGCGTIVLTVSNGVETKTPTTCWQR